MMGCAGSSVASHAARVQGAVTVLAEIVDPAYELAVNGCIARERLEVEAERERKQAPQETDQHLATIRARCDDVRDAFLAMRAYLSEAEGLLDQGHIDKAEKELEKVRAAWGRITP